MAYGSSTDGDYGLGSSAILVDPSHTDRVDIADAELLFRGHFGRSGPDLVLTGQDGHRHIVPDYFSNANRPALVTPNGARLSAELVDLLAGPQAPQQYAQATTPASAEAIGKIEKVLGIVNVVRNGVSVALHVGDAVYKSDVIQTASDASCGISFPDGTALNLIANTRMALNDYSYDPNGTSNSALFSLVEGTFAFVAGKVAHSGDMKIATPVATMGIRGTAGWSGHQLPVISSTLGDVYGFALAHDPGVDNFGRYTLLKHDLDGNPVLDASGNPVVLDSVGSLDVLALCSIDSCTHVPMTSGLSAFGQGIMQGAYDASNPSNPGANPGGHGSGDQQFAPPFQENGSGGQIQFINFTVTNGSSDQAAPIAVTTPPPPVATQATIEIGTIETNNTFIETNDIINKVDAAAGVVINGTASGSNVIGHPITIDILNGSNIVVESFTTTVQSNGMWSVDVPQVQAQALADGHYTVTANISTEAGTPATASQMVTVDETPPTITIGTIEADTIINKADAVAGVTIGGTVSDPPIDSSDIVGQTVFVTVNGKTYAGTVQPNDTWSVNVSASDALALRDGVFTVTANVADKAGNPATTATEMVTVDTVTPTVSVTTNSTDVNLEHNTATISFTFSEAPGSSFTLADTTASGGVLCNLIEVDSTHYTATFKASANAYTNDAAVSVIAGSWTENNGNPGSGGSTGNFTVDTVAPKVAFTCEHEDGESWTLTGTDSDCGGPGVKSVQIFEGGANGILLGSAQLNGNGTWCFTTAPLADGCLTFVAEVTDQAGNSATASVTVDDRIPAGVAGDPINLALTDPSGGQAAGPVTLTVTGLPSDWSLNAGTDLGNGTWTVQTSDLSALTVTTAATYTGALVLDATESWTNADGSLAKATIADNVEAYAPGAPIFALSGNDTLTGAGGHSEFVFAQPIGNDTIYNFNVATDKIDLIGFANIAGFSDIQAAVTSDASGNAVVTLGAGETITLQGIHAASLSASDFLFNQDAVSNNASAMVVSDGAVLPLEGTIDNTGAIALNSTGDHTKLQIIGDGLTIEGGGKLTLSDCSANAIVGTTSTSTLTNIDNMIAGAGQIGSDDATLTLVNQAHGTIDANVAGNVLMLETGSLITNNGVLETVNGGTLQILDAVVGSGSAIIAGGTMIFDAPSSINVAFNNGTDATTYGELVLGDAAGFSGQISGFAGIAPDSAHSDAIDLVGINYNSSAFSETYTTSNGLLTVTDGTHGAGLTFLSFDGTFSFASDGHGGTLITDPPAATSGKMSTSIDASKDTFVFQPGIGADTMLNSNQHTDAIELDHFANIQSIQQLASLITADAHGDAVMELGHSDSITIPGMTPSYLQAHLQSLVHLH